MSFGPKCKRPGWIQSGRIDLELEINTITERGQEWNERPRLENKPVGQPYIRTKSRLGQYETAAARTMKRRILSMQPG